MGNHRILKTILTFPTFIFSNICLFLLVGTTEKRKASWRARSCAPRCVSTLVSISCCSSLLRLFRALSFNINLFICLFFFSEIVIRHCIYGNKQLENWRYCTGTTESRADIYCNIPKTVIFRLLGDLDERNIYKLKDLFLNIIS